MEDDRKSVIIIVSAVFLIIIIVPIIAYAMRFEVDEEAVWFSDDGIPHCPYCFRIVEPYGGYCSDCERSFRWVDRHVKCWSCGGQKICNYCNGSGFWRYQTECFNCKGKGICPVCLDGEMEGFSIYGNSNIRHEVQVK
ncbi:MAG: hypothetical protein ABIH42_11310 [Planctomycetota bacterium]